MDKYETIKHIGDGTFGTVDKARNKTTNEIVRITWNIFLECALKISNNADRINRFLVPQG